MANLLDSVKEYLHPGFIAEASEQLGEGEEPISKALFAWCATILAGLLNWVGHEKAMGQIFDGLDHFPPNLTDNAKALLRTGNLAENDPKDVSGRLLGQLFGSKTESLVEGVATFSGTSPAHASYLLGVAGPVILSILGQRVQAGSLSHSGLSNLLLRNREGILSALPGGLAAILQLREMDPAQAEPAMEEATGFSWVLPLLLLLALGGAILFYLRYSGH